MEALRIDANTRLLVLTGAGVSAESGVPTFRGSDGLWENHPVEQMASPEGFLSHRFHHFVQGRSGEVLPKLVTFE
jgi:NAD-dependent SIR2 family protein deacetylase